jgi:SAM-dependent methyltransferase
LEGQKARTSPLKINICQSCGLWEVDSPPAPGELFNEDYRYRSSDSMGKYFKEQAPSIISSLDLPADGLVLEIGSNDGPFQEAARDLGVVVHGVDPAGNMVKEAQDKDLRSRCAFFGSHDAKKYFADESYDAVTSFNCFAHIEGIRQVFAEVYRVLRPGGRLLFEVHSQNSLLEDMQYDFIYHEHLFYHTATSLSKLCTGSGLSVISIETRDSHGGSFRVVAEKVKSPGVFNADVFFHIEECRAFLRNLGDKFAVAYGASGRANIHFSMLGQSAKKFKFVIDDSPARYGRTMANGVPVLPAADGLSHTIDVVVITAWTYADRILPKIPENIPEVWVMFPEIRRLR